MLMVTHQRPKAWSWRIAQKKRITQYPKVDYFVRLDALQIFDKKLIWIKMFELTITNLQDVFQSDTI